MLPSMVKSARQHPLGLRGVPICAETWRHIALPLLSTLLPPHHKSLASCSLRYLEHTKYTKHADGFPASESSSVIFHMMFHSKRTTSMVLELFLLSSLIFLRPGLTQSGWSYSTYGLLSSVPTRSSFPSAMPSIHLGSPRYAPDTVRSQGDAKASKTQALCWRAHHLPERQSYKHGVMWSGLQERCIHIVMGIQLAAQRALPWREKFSWERYLLSWVLNEKSR